MDEDDQDSLFGSPPPSPARGRSPSRETSTQAEQVGFGIAAPSMGVPRKNVGTIALPGSHMSCAELPANLPALSLSLPRTASSHNSSSTAPPGTTRTLAFVQTPTTASRPVSSRSSSLVSTAPSASTSTSTSTKKRRPYKAKSQTSASLTPPITLPGPDEPTPPNFLRSQSSLLGLAGLVGSVKPSRLHTHGPQSTPQHLPIRGSTPTHPIVLDDEQDTTQQPHSQAQMSQRLEQFNPETLRLNMMASLMKEKNIFPVLESLIKLLGAEPHAPAASPPPQPFARPYGHGVFHVQSALPVTPTSAGDDPNSPSVPPPKRRRLKHVPAGAVDWDVPFPFAVGEGPEGYRNTWARDRAKQLITQLLELIQNAAKRAAIKTTKSKENASERRARAQNLRTSRSASVETQTRLPSLPQEGIRELMSHTSSDSKATVAGTVSRADSQRHLPDSLQSPSTTGSPVPGPVSINSEGVAEGADSVIPCDYAAFEEWLSQLQQFVETGMPSKSGCSTYSSLSLDPSLSGLASTIHAPTPHDTVSTSDTIQDEPIDPTLLAMSQLGDISQVFDICSVPTLSHSPRTSLSSLTEPLTPLSEAFADVPTSTMNLEDVDRGSPVDQPVSINDRSRALLAKLFEPSCSTTIRKEKAGVTPPTSGRSTPGIVSTTFKGVFDKQAVLERARERRRQLVAEIERAKIELWETSIENAVLVHLTRDGSLGSS